NVVTVARVGGNNWAIDQLALEVFGLKNFTELLNTPLCHQELEASTVTQASEAVVAENSGDASPHFWNLIKWNPRTKWLSKHWVGGQATAHKALKSWAEFWVNRRNEGNVLDFVGNILALVASDSSLKLTRKVVELFLV